MNKPFFSIITCTKNSEKFLSENLLSVKKQTFKDFEHIFIDGHSSDNTLKIIDKYKNNSVSKIKVFSFAPKGVNNALNHGAKKSSGKWIFFLNSDDKFNNVDVLKKTYDLLSSKEYKNCDWVYGSIKYINDNNINLGVFPSTKIFKNNNYLLLKLYNYIPHQAVFMKKSMFVKHKMYFNEKIKTVGDNDLWLRIGEGFRWKYLDLVVSDYRMWKLNNAKKYSLKVRFLENFKIHYKRLNLVEMFIFLIIWPLSDIYYNVKIYPKIFLAKLSTVLS